MKLIGTETHIKLHQILYSGPIAVMVLYPRSVRWLRRFSSYLEFNSSSALIISVYGQCWVYSSPWFTDHALSCEIIHIWHDIDAARWLPFDVFNVISPLKETAALLFLH